MNKILLLVSCLVSLAAAGVLDVRGQGTISMSSAGQRIERMSREDLQRQKFLLDVLHRVQQPLQEQELIRLDRGLIVDNQRYIGGIDTEMRNIIELDRQRQLLGQQEICSVLDVEHVRQLRGIYLLLVRAQDWQTLQSNIVYLRRNINPELLVNAMALALRDRVDTQNLIMPLLEEVLPELHLNVDLIERVHRLVVESTMQHQSVRPNILELMGQRVHGLNILNRSQLWMPWRELRMQMAMRRIGQKEINNNIRGEQQHLVVLSMEDELEQPGMNLITKDIGLRSFVHGLINDLAMAEIEGEIEQRRGGGSLDIGNEQLLQRGNDESELRQQIGIQQLPISEINQDRLLRINRRRQQQSIENERDWRTDDDAVERNIGGGIGGGIGGRIDQRVGSRINQVAGGVGGVVDNLPSLDIDDQRLLRVGRRRLNGIRQEQEQQRSLLGRQGQRFMGLVREQTLSEGRRVVDEQQGQRNVQEGNWIDIEEQQRGNQRQMGRIALEREEGHGIGIGMGISNEQNLRSVPRDDERLVHINRRRMNQQQEQQEQEQLLGQRWNMPRLVDNIGEGRRVADSDSGQLDEEDIMQLIRRDNRLTELSDDQIIQLLQRQREQRRQRMDEGQDTIQERRNSIERGNRGRRSIGDDDVNVGRNELLLHNLRQLMARISQERISLRQDLQLPLRLQGSGQRLNNPRQQIDERLMLRLNEMRLGTRRERTLLEQINEIESRLQLVIGQQMRQLDVNRDQRQMDRIIGDVLIGRLGQVGILRTLRELMQSNGQNLTIESLIRLNDPLLQHLLCRIVQIADRERELQLGVYNREQLILESVRINDVRVDQLRTRIDQSDVDLVNLLEHQVGEQQERLVVARQHRLNNRDFNIDMDISSERDQQVILRLLLGPRQDAQGRDLTLDERRGDFLLLDTLPVELQKGRNRIQRNSNDISWTTRDATPYSEIYRRVMLALRQEDEQIQVGQLVGENGRFPQRLLLPRGRRDGLPMQLLVIVSPVVEEQHQRQMQRQLPGIGIGLGSVQLDERSLGYPLDRRIDNERQLLGLSNVRLQDVLIIHEN